MGLIDADKLKPDCLTKDGRLAISQSQIANAPTIEAYSFEQLQELVKLNQQFAQEIENLNNELKRVNNELKRVKKQSRLYRRRL